MMQYLMIENQGEVCLDSLRFLGASDKIGPNSIGQFGSGFKYAVAAAIRNQIPILLTSGRKTIKFGTVSVPLRGRLIDVITMNGGRRDWTVEMGKADWCDKPSLGVTVAWLIVRELMSNALDELGRVEIRESPKLRATRGVTRVYVGLVGGVREVLQDLGEYFLNRGKRKPIWVGDGVSLYESTNSVYSRGVFVQHVPQPTLWDYDFLKAPLSESRTLNAWDMQRMIGELMPKLPEAMLADGLSRLIKSCHFESGIQTYHLGSLSKMQDTDPGTVALLPEPWRRQITGKRRDVDLICDARYAGREFVRCLKELGEADRRDIWNAIALDMKQSYI